MKDKEICGYGCNRDAEYPPRKGKTKWSCESEWRLCPFIANNKSIKMKNKWNDENSLLNNEEVKIKRIAGVKKSWQNDNARRIKLKEWNREKWDDKDSFFNSEERRRKISEGNKGKIISEETRRKLSSIVKRSIKQINERHPFFSKIEEIRYNPDKLIEEKEIQAHCKYFDCINSKEKGGWFTPTYTQISERVRCLEKGVDNSYFYCCQKCKDMCPIYNSHGDDPYKNKETPYTDSEYQTFRQHVLTRDNHLCQFCGSIAVHVHHERPQKLEPFFALDPDFAWSCCEDCHYSKGHTGECNTGNLANKVCKQKVVINET